MSKELKDDGTESIKSVGQDAERGDGVTQARANRRASPQQAQSYTQRRATASSPQLALEKGTPRAGSIVHLEGRILTKMRDEADVPTPVKITSFTATGSTTNTSPTTLLDLEYRILEKVRSAIPSRGAAISEETSITASSETENKNRAVSKRDIEGGEQKRPAGPANHQDGESRTSSFEEAYSDALGDIAPIPDTTGIDQTQAHPGAYAEAGVAAFHQLHVANFHRRQIQTSQRRATLGELEEGVQSSTLSSDLVVAHPVVGERSQDLPRGVEESKERTFSMERSERRAKYLALGLVLFGFVVISGVAVLVTTQIRSNGEVVFAPSGHMTAIPSEAPTLSPQQRVLSFFSENSIKRVEEQGSPQSKAFQWLLDDPALTAYPQWRLLQRYSLATLYYALGGPRWASNAGWLNYSIHECYWFSKGSFDSDFFDSYFNETHHPNPCEEDLHLPGAIGEVKHIWLYKNSLEGRLPPELFSLTSLRTINLRSNSLSGSIPSFIGQLTNLEMLALQANVLSGMLPSEIGLLSESVGMWLSANQLEGTIPTELGSLRNHLQHLMLDSNQFTGSIPYEITSMTNLDELYLSDNSLTGTVHTELGRLSNLLGFALGMNQLTSTIPTELKMPNAMFVYLSFNFLSGAIPSEVLGSLTNALHLSLQSNQLHGTIPSLYGSLTQLEMFSLSDNLLSGTIPTDLGLLKNATYVPINSNQLEGSLPSQVGLMSNLRWFTVHDNPKMSGTLPTELGMLSNLQKVSIGDIFSGVVPEEMCLVDLLAFECSPRLCGCDCPCFPGDHNSTDSAIKNNTIQLNS